MNWLTEHQNIIVNVSAILGVIFVFILGIMILVEGVRFVISLLKKKTNTAQTAINKLRALPPISANTISIGSRPTTNTPNPPANSVVNNSILNLLPSHSTDSYLTFEKPSNTNSIFRLQFCKVDLTDVNSNQNSSLLALLDKYWVPFAAVNDTILLMQEIHLERVPASQLTGGNSSVNTNAL